MILCSHVENNQCQNNCFLQATVSCLVRELTYNYSCLDFLKLKKNVAKILERQGVTVNITVCDASIHFCSMASATAQGL